MVVVGHISNSTQISQMNKQFNFTSAFFNKLSEITKCLLIGEGEGGGEVFQAKMGRKRGNFLPTKQCIFPRPGARLHCHPFSNWRVTDVIIILFFADGGEKLKTHLIFLDGSHAFWRQWDSYPWAYKVGQYQNFGLSYLHQKACMAWSISKHDGKVYFNCLRPETPSTA